MIDAPGYGKDIVNAINSCDKRYLKEKICMVGTPEVKDITKRMKNHHMARKSKSSWVIICKYLLKNNIRVHGVKSYKKCGKREMEQKIKKERIIYNIWKMRKW